MGGILGVLCLALMVGYELALVFLLSNKLLGMVEERGNIAKSMNNEADFVDIDTFETATKYASLIILGNVSTFLCCTVLVTSLIVPPFNPPGGVFIAMDVFVNATSLFLMFNFSHRSYSKYCSKYHMCLQNMCIGCAYKGQVKDKQSKLEFASLVLNADA